MFVRMLTADYDQNDSYEIAIDGFQVRNINEIRNVIFVKISMKNHRVDSKVNFRKKLGKMKKDKLSGLL